MTNRWRWIAVLACLVLVEPAGSANAQDTKKPNILLLFADDMGYGDVGCYGSTQIETPNIDRLAAEGVRFTQGYVSGAVCAPSRAGMLTGRYQERFGFDHNLSEPEHVHQEWCAIPRDEKTIADRLQAAGYRTGIIGKWHLGGSKVDWHHPNARGFDHFFGMIRGHHSYFVTNDLDDLWMNREAVTQARRPYLTDWLVDETIDFIEGSGDQPWFTYLSFTTPHTPLQAKREDLARFSHIADKKRRTYCAMQHCLDENIGRLLAHLEESGDLDNTLIVFLNDNGGSTDVSTALNAPLRGQKSMYTEGGIRVPFIMRWPGHVPAGGVYEHPVISLDLLPTFLTAAGAEMPNEFIGRGRNRRPKIYDGVDLLPFVRGQRGAERPHRTLYWRMVLRGAAIRDGDWKLLRLPHRPAELYDLSSDVSELNNLAAEYPERVRELLEKLHEWECTFERNPLFLSSNSWAPRNRQLYDREYQLEQP